MYDVLCVSLLCFHSLCECEISEIKKLYIYTKARIHHFKLSVRDEPIFVQIKLLMKQKKKKTCYLSKF